VASWLVQFTIRKYRPEDFPKLLAIDQACFAPGIAYSAFEMKTYIQRKSAFTFVAEEPGPAVDLKTIVGERTGGIGHIITIDILAEARRHRLGSSLLELAEKEFRLGECSLARLETAVDNVSALSFYKRHGYHVIRTIPRYYSNGVDALLMEKDLLSPAPAR
jgi:[ribosomal protein S18]-alanine N-acetyltransferase